MAEKKSWLNWTIREIYLAALSIADGVIKYGFADIVVLQLGVLPIPASSGPKVCFAAFILFVNQGQSWVT